MGLLLALTVQSLVACSSQMTCDEVQVKARLVDSETGRPVSRSSIYVHAYNDSQDMSVSLEPGDGNQFELCLGDPEIRLLIHDSSSSYEKFEESFTATEGVLDIEVHLKPTHWIRLHGTLLWEDASGDLHPQHEGSDMVRHAQLSAVSVNLSPTHDGHYSVKAPRTLLEFLSINTSYVHSPRVIDLSGVTEDEFEIDFILKPSQGREC